MEQKEQIFATKNLEFKHGNLDDVEKYHRNFWSESETAKYMLWAPTENVDEAKMRLKKWLESTSSRNYYFMYEKMTNQPVGFIAFMNLGDGKWGEIALCIGKNFTHKGYGAQALEFVEKYAKEKGGKLIEYSCLENNVASKNLATKMGYKQSYIKDRYIKKVNRTDVEIVFEKQI